MQTEAVFENIADRIQAEIKAASKSIFIAVAWFTNKNLFEELLKKKNEGCRVSLIISNDSINTLSGIEYEKLSAGNSKVYRVGDGANDLMHNKFCVIDFNTVITGSYNWSNKAEYNFENVVINQNDTALAEQFIKEFNQIVKQYFPNEKIAENDFPIVQVLRRLEILKNYVLLEDINALEAESKKLTEYSFNTDISEITNLIASKEYAEAVRKIQNFISANQQLSVFIDTEIFALKLEIKNLENQLNAFDNEKIEIEKLLHDFQHRHTIELGEIIIRILQLRKIVFKNDKEKLEEAERDYNNYNEQVKNDKKRKVFELTDEEKKELKTKFRKATFLCHPDKVSDEFKTAAEELFIELKAAYEINDLNKVSELLSEMERGNFFRSKSETISEKILLKAAIDKLKRQIKKLENEMLEIKNSEAFKIIIEIKDWGLYFEETKTKLQLELSILEKQNEVGKG